MLKQYHMMVLLTFVIDALKGYTYTRRSVLGLIYRVSMAPIFSQFGGQCNVKTGPSGR